MAKYTGIVEGFYWRQQHKVNGRFKEYDPVKRIKLLEFMSYKGLNAYVYDPKVLRGKDYERAYRKDLIGDINMWRKTFKRANELGISFLWGVAPGRKEKWINKPLKENLDYILQLGAQGFVFLFDDVPGGATDSEKDHQIELLNNLKNEFPVIAICPGNYAGSRGSLEKKLDVFDKNLNPDIDIIVTGEHTWNGIISYDKLPHYKNRETWYWDNWMASDTDAPDRLFLKPPKARKASLFDNCGGYILNPCFPIERIIPMVSAIGEISKGFRISNTNEYEYNDKLKELLVIIAKDWSQFLDVDSDILLKLINKSVLGDNCVVSGEEINQVIDKWESLKPIFKVHFDMKEIEIRTNLKDLAKRLKIMQWESFIIRDYHPIHGHMEDSVRKWNENSILRFGGNRFYSQEDNCVVIDSPIPLDHNHWKVIYPYSIKEFFYWEIGVSGDIRMIQLQADSGEDRLIVTELQINGNFQDIQYFRVYGNIKKPENICFEHIIKNEIDSDGYYLAKKLKTKLLKIDHHCGSYYPAIAAPRDGKIKIHHWMIAGAIKTD